MNSRQPEFPKGYDWPGDALSSMTWSSSHAEVSAGPAYCQVPPSSLDVASRIRLL